MFPLIQLRKKLHRRKRRGIPTASPAPPPPVSATVTLVTAQFTNEHTVWTFDQPVTILPGSVASDWAVFTIFDETGAQTCVGASALQLSPTTIRITLDSAPEDFGNGWFWEVLSVPAKVQTTSGGAVNVGEGDVVFA